MTGPVTVRNAVDTYIDQAKPTKPIKQGTGFRLKTAGGASQYGFMFFTIPFPRGSVIKSAKLRLYAAEAMGNTTLTVRKVSKKWSASSITWNNSLTNAVVGATATKTIAASVKGTLWEVDVTALMQEVSSGMAWYGFRITKTGADSKVFYATESATASRRPVLVIEWANAPEEPDDLTPSGGLAVNVNKPVLTYDFIDKTGEGDLAAHQIQFGDDDELLNAGTATWDSGEVATTMPMFDTAASAWAGLAEGASIWWRVRAKDIGGLWSPWSDAVQFSRVAKGVLSMTPTDAIWEGSPSFTLSLSGIRPITSSQLVVYDNDNPSTPIWSSGQVPYDEHNIPFGVISNPDADYKIVARAWDDVDRVSTPGDPAYSEVIDVLPVEFDGLIAAPSLLNISSDPMFPIAQLDFTYTGPATDFQFLRSGDDGDTWEYVGEADVLDVSMGGNLYRWLDNTSPHYKPVLWRVVAVAGHQSNPVEAGGEIKRLAPFLYRDKGVDAVCFLNPSRSMRFADVHGIHEPLGGASVVVTQRLGKRMGSVAGRLVSNILPVSAKDQLDRFLGMRKTPGATLYLAIANETITVNCYNFAYDILTDAEGISYQVSCDWIEV